MIGFHIKNTFFLIIVLVATGCFKEEEISIKTTTFFFDPVVTHLTGVVKDPLGSPLSGVMVTTGDLTRQTDGHGFFAFYDIVVNKNGQMVEYEKEGYAPEVAYLLTVEGQNMATEVTLQKENTVTIDQSEKGALLLDNEWIRIELPPDAVKGPNGLSYQGPLHFNATLAPNGERQRYGKVIVRDRDENGHVLSSSHQLMIELQDGSGHVLFLEKPLACRLKQGLPDSRVWKHSSSLQTFYEKQTIQTDGTFELDSSGYYLLGSPQSYTLLSGRVMAGQKALQNTSIDLNTTTMSVHLITNEKGYYRVYLPSSTRMDVTITQFDGHPLVPSNDHIYISGDHQALDFTLLDGTYPSLSSTVIDCQNTPLREGYAVVNETLIVPLSDSGTFEQTLIPSGDDVTVQIVNHATGEQGKVIVVPVTLGSTNLPKIKTCILQEDQYLSYGLDDKTVWVDTPIASKVGGEIQIYANHPDFQNPSNFQDFFITFSDDGQAIQPLLTAEVYLEQGGITYYGKCSGNCTSNLTVEIVSMGETVGDIILGRISGNLNSIPAGKTYWVEAEFNVIRDF